MTQRLALTGNVGVDLVGWCGAVDVFSGILEVVMRSTFTAFNE